MSQLHSKLLTYIRSLPICPYYDKKDDFLNVDNYYDFLNSFSRDVEPTKVLEIGTRYSYAAVSFSYEVPSVKKYVGLDIEVYDQNSLEKAKTNLSFFQSGKKEFTFSLKKIDTQKMENLDFLDKETFDLIHVDGDHSTEGAYCDIINFWNVLNIGGHMLIDDSIFYQNVIKDGIKKALKEIKEPSYEINSLRGTWVIRKTKEKTFPILRSLTNEMSKK